MNKIGLVLGVTAVTALVGCLDPKYKGKRTPVTTTTPSAASQQKTIVDVEPTPVEVDPIQTIEVTPIAPHPDPVPQTIQIKPASVTPSPAVAETTTYIIQPGDTLSKISKRYNITIAAIKRENPQIKDDNVVKLGQKIKLPGKVEVGEQKVPANAFAKTTSQTAKAYTPYTGATKEYVVKNGDVLGSIARKHGCSVRQLKELNGMTNDVVRVNQKLKVPSEKTVGATVSTESKPEKKPVAAPAKLATPAPEVKKSVDTKDTVKTVTDDQPEEAEKASTPAPAPAPAPAASGDDFITYTVQEGEDITSVSIQTYVSPSEIRQLNNLSDDAQLKPGMVLKLPAGALQ